VEGLHNYCSTVFGVFDALHPSTCKQVFDGLPRGLKPAAIVFISTQNEIKLLKAEFFHVLSAKFF
jgi:hypothetical protein